MFFTFRVITDAMPAATVYGNFDIIFLFDLAFSELYSTPPSHHPTPHHPTHAV